MKHLVQDQILSRWLQQHQGLLNKVARSFAGTNRHDRDDLFQEIVLQVWRSIPRYPSGVAESTWIYRVALYTAVNWHRKESKQRDKGRALLVEPIDEKAPADPRLDWLYEKIAELNAVDRSLALLMLDGFSYREISSTLGISESNVGVRINRIKKKFVTKLQREAGDEL